MRLLLKEEEKKAAASAGEELRQSCGAVGVKVVQTTEQKKL
jgi:hypothetical protein